MHRMLDLLNLPFAACAALLARAQARLGPERLPWSYRVWDRIGVSPLPFHYYQPLVRAELLDERHFTTADALRGIDWDAQAQLELLASFHYQQELAGVPQAQPPGDSRAFYYDNPSFGPADAEMLYNMVRHFKPRRVIEIGSGHSTRMLRQALQANRAGGAAATHTCIEPYEMPWLESLGVDEVIRSRVEQVDPALFQSLAAGDILFIDSSHVVRTGGDVVFEYLRILPELKPGVLVHVHDIFLPYDYPREWVIGKRRLWTEQYLLQAFLAFNPAFRILAAVNFLALHHPRTLGQACPTFARQGKGGHGSFWIQRI